MQPRTNRRWQPSSDIGLSSSRERPIIATTSSHASSEFWTKIKTTAKDSSQGPCLGHWPLPFSAPDQCLPGGVSARVKFTYTFPGTYVLGTAHAVRQSNRINAHSPELAYTAAAALTLLVDLKLGEFHLSLPSYLSLSPRCYAAVDPWLAGPPPGQASNLPCTFSRTGGEAERGGTKKPGLSNLQPGGGDGVVQTTHGTRKNWGHAESAASTSPCPRSVSQSKTPTWRTRPSSRLRWQKKAQRRCREEASDTTPAHSPHPFASSYSCSASLSRWDEMGGILLQSACLG